MKQKKTKGFQDMKPEVAEEPKVESEVEKASEEQLQNNQNGSLWEACSYLTSEGRNVAAPGDVVFLPKALSDFYLETAPGSIKPADPVE